MVALLSNRTWKQARVFPASPILYLHVNIFQKFLSNALKNQLLFAIANFLQNLRNYTQGLLGGRSAMVLKLACAQSAPEGWGTPG